MVATLCPGAWLYLLTGVKNKYCNFGLDPDTRNALPYKTSCNRILVIDDDLDDQEIFLTAMASVCEKMQCTMASSSVDALKKLAAGDITTDIIFLDLNMPVMTGQQFLTEIKKHIHLRDIPVIVLSTTSHQPTIDHAKSLGAVEFITKPDKFTDLVAILNNILN